MSPPRLVGLAFALASAPWLAGCSSSSSSSTSDHDAGVHPDAGGPAEASVDATGADSPADSGNVCLSTREGGVGGCNSLEPGGAIVASSCARGSLPSAMGGTIALGTYILTAKTNYGCLDAGLPPVQTSATKVICGDLWQIAEQEVGASPVQETETVSTSGTALTVDTTCGATTGTTTWGYTATATTLTMILSGTGSFDEVEVWSLQ